ncbi:TadE/TadG family type IV pilus assembly protein [Streptomyces sp. HNM0663]|uniref:TadE/TadG family type IV pilus assembly protein n=1 Tax=Streptomyces chengmaiensis TaxID=3040919 RepID=A0ABT6HV69_9ACTN|nr:TadE/TadG family type IV pilus assembly protein [Streptomyces chengmaiensis]MDH2392222.1 TadE/TadG family type IV pilus assembly protein [Streptomyces chengmaiensis]
MNARTNLQQLAQALRRDRGSYALETAILAPVMIGLLLLMIAFGRVTDADGAVDSAARAAARAASLERDAGSAQAEAQAAANRSLQGEGITCQASSVVVDTSGYALDIGVEANVTATIACTANLSDIGLPGLPGSKTLTASWTSPIDTHRGRS